MALHLHFGSKMAVDLLHLGSTESAVLYSKTFQSSRHQQIPDMWIPTEILKQQTSHHNGSDSFTVISDMHVHAEEQSKQMKELQKLLYLSVLVVGSDGNNKQYRYPQLRLFSYRTSDRPLDMFVTTGDLVARLTDVRTDGWIDRRVSS